MTILTEESVRFAELVAPGPNNFEPVGLALAQSETPWDRSLADIDRALSIYDAFIDDFVTASKRLADATDGVGRHALSVYGEDLEDVFETMTEIYTQFRDQLQEAVLTQPEHVLRGTYFSEVGRNIVDPVARAVLSPEPLPSFRVFVRHLTDNCPDLLTMLVDAWLTAEIQGRLIVGHRYRHWDMGPLVTTTAPPIP